MADTFPNKLYGDLSFSAVLLKMHVFWDVIPCVNLSGLTVAVIPDDEDTVFLQMTNSNSPDYMASQHRTTYPESSIQQKSQMVNCKPVCLKTTQLKSHLKG
jgi:hypothetical protein